MACGTPVACSNSSSLPEVVGDAAVMFDPLKINEIISAINKILKDKVAMDKYIENGYLKCNKFKWEQSIHLTNQEISNSKF